MAKLIEDTTLPADFLNGQILYGEDLNKIVKILREGVNINWAFKQATLFGSSNVLYAESIQQLEEQTALKDTYGYVVNLVKDEENTLISVESIDGYIFNGTSWDYIQRMSLIDIIQSMKNLDAESVTIKPNIYTEAEITKVGQIFYNSEKHALTYLTDLGEYLEIGSNLGDFGKNNNGYVFEGQPVTLTGVQGASPIKIFDLANINIPSLSKMVGVLTTSNNEDGSLTPGQVGKISVFGDVKIPDWSKILDSTFLSNLGVNEYKDIPVGTKLYLSGESGKYTALPTRIWVATVIYTSQNNKTGRIFVYPHEDFPDTFQVSYEEPTSLEVTLWYKVLDASPAIYSIINGGTFDTTPTNILYGGTFDTTPTDSILGGNY